MARGSRLSRSSERWRRGPTREAPPPRARGPRWIACRILVPMFAGGMRPGRCGRQAGLRKRFALQQGCTRARGIAARAPPDLVRHAETTAEFVVDETGDAAAPIPLKARLAVVFGRRERILPARGEDVPLPAGVTHEHLALTPYDHPVLGAVRKSILADELVEHTGPDPAREGDRRRPAEEGLADASGELAPEPEARRIDALAREADADAQGASDRPQRLAEEVEEDDGFTFFHRKGLHGAAEESPL